VSERVSAVERRRRRQERASRPSNKELLVGLLPLGSLPPGPATPFLHPPIVETQNHQKRPCNHDADDVIFAVRKRCFAHLCEFAVRRQKIITALLVTVPSVSANGLRHHNEYDKIQHYSCGQHPRPKAPRRVAHALSPTWLQPLIHIVPKGLCEQPQSDKRLQIPEDEHRWSRSEV